MMKKMILLLLCMFSAATYAVTVSEKNGVYTIKNDSYTIIFSKNNAWAGAVHLKKSGSCLIMPYLFLDTELQKYDGRKNPKPVMVNRRKLNFTAKLLENSAEKAVLEITGEFNGGKMTETITFDNTPAIRYQFAINHAVRLHLHSLKLLANFHSPEAIIIPDGKRVSGYPTYGNVVTGKSWRGLWDPSWNLCAILGSPDEKNAAGIEYGMRGRKEGDAAERTDIGVSSVPLARRGVSGKQEISYVAILSEKQETSVKTAEQIFGKKEFPHIFSYETEKLTIRPGNMNSLFVQVKNPGEKQELTLRTSVIYSLDKETVIDTRKVAVPQGKITDLQIPVKLPPEANLGIAVRTDLLDESGKMIDSAREFFSVTTFSPRETSFGITNVDVLHKEGMIEAQNSGFKRRYVGAYEYYCWAKSVIGGLAPEEDSWIPNTEHNFNKVITKKLIKNLVADAHKKGVGVYAWITGLWDYHYAFRYPERLQYNKEGQPNLYSGAIYPDGRRRAVVKAHMFTPERAAEWGKEMADSIDMFGWDGCRWDWSFCPNMLSDPLFMGEHAEDWYDWKGVPSSELFPDPDKTSVECLIAWRKAVAERHPDFIYGTNYGSRPALMKMNPKYKIESARNALTLFEDMAAFNRKEWATFELWGTELVRRIDVIRPHGAAPVVGFMQGLPLNSVSYNLARYTALAAGIKWWDSNIITIDTPGDQVRNRFLLRYAEWFFGTEFLHPETSSITITNSEKILYKPFDRERKTENGREIIFSMINMPEDNEYICEFHEEPVVKKNIEVKVHLNPGESIDNVWLLNPHDPEKAIRLSVKNNAFFVPELIDFSAVLIQVKGK